MSAINNYLAELRIFIHPLAYAASSADAAKSFLEQFGYEVDQDTLMARLNGLDPSLEETIDALQASIEAGGAIEVAEQAFEAIGNFAEAVALEIGAQLNDLLPEVFDFLVVRYLGIRLPPAASILNALGVILLTEEQPADSGRDIQYTKTELRWANLGQFLSDNESWADEVYGWGTDFNHQLAIARMINVLESTMLATAHLRDMSSSEASTSTSAFLRNPINNEQKKADIPVLQGDFEDVTADGVVEFSNEAGISVLPFGNQNSPANLGLAFAPYFVGGVDQQLELGDRVTLSAELGVSADAGAASFVTVQPDGVDIKPGDAGAVDAIFEVGLQFRNEDNAPIVIAEIEDAHRIEVEAMLASVGGNLSGDFYVAAGVENLSATIDVSQDGFLGAIVPEPINVEVGSIIMGWRAGRGVYFDGGTSVMVTVPLDLQLGPIQIYEVVLIVDWSAGVSVSVLLTADASLGPLYAYVEQMGLTAIVTQAPDNDGLLGQYDLRFEFRAPTGYAIALDAEPIEGGGFLSVNGSEYRGALALKFQQWGFSAFGILNTELPNNRTGFSFAASIFGEFSLPLGYGFFLTGLGGIIGINRTVDTEALRDVLYEGRFDNILFPADPIENARTILDDMAAIMPVSEGQHLFGPVAKIGWGQPVLIEVTLGVVIEVGQEIRVLILGGVGMALPTKEAAIVDLNLNFFGAIDFAAGTIDFDASLEGSRVLTFTITGDCAVRTGWAPRLQHVASFGGLHPEYPRPSNLPDLQRLSISFGSNNPRITLSAYQAITTNAFMFGARASLYAKGPKVWLVGQIAAEGEIYFDALVYFNPFHFDVVLGGGLRLLVDGSVQAGLGFSLRLRGPNQFIINGRVWITVFGIDIDFRIDHTWGSAQSLPIQTLNAVEVLRSAITETGNLEVIQPSSRTAGVTFNTQSDVENLIDPIGGVRFIQRAMPLDVTIEKIGEAQAVGERRLDITVQDVDGNTIAVNAETEDFVRAHFFETTENERLRAAVFETYKAGFALSSESLFGPTDKAVEEDYGYEFIEIGESEDNRAHLTLKNTIVKPINAQFSDRWMRFSIDSISLSELTQPMPNNLVTLENDVYVSERNLDNVRAEFQELTVNGADQNVSAVGIASAGIARTEFQLLREDLSINAKRVSVEGAESNPLVSGYIAAAGI